MPKTYTTVSGDEWDMIAKRELGGERYAGALMAANPAYINTAIFSAGVRLVIPDIKEAIPATLPPWKRGKS